MSDDNKANVPNADKADEELSALLDSALEDFKKESTKDDAAESTEEASKEKEGVDKTLEEWNEEFISQAAAQFESSMAALLGTNSDGAQASPEQIEQKLQQMAEAAHQVINNPTISDNSTDFAATIAQTIQGLSAGAEGLQAPFSEQDFASLFGSQDTNAFVPFMQGMMQSILSKDILYPSLKDILDKFPSWLNTNRSELATEDIERYENQMKLMDEVCKELESEKESDGADVKKGRFDKVLSLMQKLQDYGQPPADLVGDVGPPLPINEIDPNQCSLM